MFLALKLGLSLQAASRGGAASPDREEDFVVTGPSLDPALKTG